MIHLVYKVTICLFFVCRERCGTSDSDGKSRLGPMGRCSQLAIRSVCWWVLADQLYCVLFYTLCTRVTAMDVVIGSLVAGGCTLLAGRCPLFVPYCMLFYVLSTVCDTSFVLNSQVLASDAYSLCQLKTLPFLLRLVVELLQADILFS